MHRYHPGTLQNQAQAAAYCAGRGMRLPTLDEALALSAGVDTCAFPCDWFTWTSSSSGPGLAWRANYLGGSAFENAATFSYSALCVQ